MLKVTIVGANKINHSGGWSSLNGFRKKIDLDQNSFAPWDPMNKSLKIKPENIAPIDSNIKGINIMRGDSCVSSILIFLLL